MIKRLFISAIAIISTGIFASCIFKNSTSANKAPVSVATLSKNKIQLPQDYFGFNTQMIHGPGWDNDAFLASVKKLNPQNLRYPGGTIANYWDWKQGWFFKTPDVPNQYKNAKPVPVTLESFKKAIDATGATPVFVLNLLTSDINYQTAMLKHAQSIGLKVKYIELGNEFYGKEEAAIKKYPTGKDYAIDANKWIAALKKDFPGARIAVVGCGKTDVPTFGKDDNKIQNPKERVENWDAELFANVKNADAVTYHIYSGPGLQAGKSKDKSNPKDKNNKNKQQELTDNFASNIHTSLGMPFVKMQQIKSYNASNVPAGMKTWFTEYNLFEKNVVVSGTWDHGLYVSAMTLLFLNDERTELICNHNITKNARFAAIFNDENGFDEYLNPVKTKQFGFSAGGLCLSVIGEALKNKTSMQHLDFSSAETLKTIKQVTYESLLGYQFTGDNSESILIINFSANASTVDLKKVTSKNLDYVTYSSNPVQQIADDKTVNKQSGSLKGNITLPAYSITLLQ